MPGQFLLQRDLIFTDQRTFDWLSVEPMVDGVPRPTVHFARDPFDPLFAKQAVITQMRLLKVAIGRTSFDSLYIYKRQR